MATDAAIGSLMIYQVGPTCLMVPKIPVRGLSTYFAGGPFAICDLALQLDLAIKAQAHALLLPSRASDGAVLPKFDRTIAAESFAGLMRDFAASMGLSMAKLEKGRFGGVCDLKGRCVRDRACGWGQGQVRFRSCARP